MRVAVVGAGIAGLRTAQLLERAGVDVTVFEARNRVGGRMCTHQVGGAEFEGGAEWIDAEHRRVLALLREFGFQAVPSGACKRRHWFCGSDVPRPVVHVCDGDGATLRDRLAASARTLVERAYLEATVLSDEGIDSDQVDLDEWRRFSANYAERSGHDDGMSAFHFDRPTSQVCEGIRSVIKGDVCLSSELVAVRDSYGIVLKFHDGTKETFDEVVLTLPPPCLGNVRCDLPRYWEGIQMTPTCKVALLFDEPFWVAEGWSGHLLSDLEIQQVWPRGNMLVCYINGRAAERIAGARDPVSAALGSLERIAPSARERFVAGRIVDWRRDPYAGGGFPYLSLGATRAALPPRGPIRFAGDWTANWIGFVEGALESAERVVEEFKHEHGVS